MRHWLAGFLLPGVVWAQGAVPTEFPPDAVTLADDVLQQRMAGKVYRARLTDGATWRIDYKGNGYAFLNTGSGYSDSGKWWAKDGQLCLQWSRAPSGCLPTRGTADAVYIKRDSNGEVVAFRPD